MATSYKVAIALSMMGRRRRRRRSSSIITRTT